jgi:hypothetical protein
MVTEKNPEKTEDFFLEASTNKKIKNNGGELT